MEYEIFTICDNAQNYNGKLVIVGTFDTVSSPKYPFVQELFSLAIKINCQTSEFKDGKLQVFIKDEKNGRDISNPITMQVPKNDSIPMQVITLVVNFQNTVYSEPGEYFIEVHFNGDVRRRQLHLLLQ